jgi:hypothetical protein
VFVKHLATRTLTRKHRKDNNVATGNNILGTQSVLPSKLWSSAVSLLLFLTKLKKKLVCLVIVVPPKFKNTVAVRVTFQMEHASQKTNICYSRNNCLLSNYFYARAWWNCFEVTADRMAYRKKFCNLVQSLLHAAINYYC